jgi:hypothetical protein
VESTYKKQMQMLPSALAAAYMGIDFFICERDVCDCFSWWLDVTGCFKERRFNVGKSLLWKR